MIIQGATIWNSIVTWKDNARDTKLHYSTLSELVDLDDTYKMLCDKIRMLEYGSALYKEAKGNYPLMYIAGKFENKVSKDAKIEFNNLMTIDIDAKDNPDKDLDEVRDFLFSLPYVAGIFHSLSGKGLYAIVPIEDQLETESYYKALNKTWYELYGIVTDNQACDLSRGRFISYDDRAKAYMKYDEVQVWKKKILKPKVEVTKTTLFGTDDDDLHDCIKYMVDNGFSIDDFNCSNYRATWWHVGCDFCRFNDGYDLFYRFSKQSTKYQDEDDKAIEKCFSQCRYDGDDDAMAKKYFGMCNKLYGKKSWRSSK